MLRSRWTIALAIVAVTTPLFVAAFHPPQLVLDTYDYMFRGFVILSEGSHPLGFGLLLRALAGASRLLGSTTFPYVFQTWQIACVVLGAAALCGPRVQPLRERPWSRHLLLVAWFTLTIWLAFPAVVYLANGYLSEPTAFLLMTLAAVAFGRAHDDARGWHAWALFGAACVVGYYVRYQQVVVPLAGALVVLVQLLKRRITRKTFMLHGALLLTLAAAVPLSQQALAIVAPREEYGAKQPEVFLRKSIQCRLDCRVRMFDTACDTPEGRTLIQASTCAHMVHLLEDALGQPYPERRGILGTLVSLSPGELYDWLVRSPVDYLKEKQPPFEMLGYAYDHKVHFFAKAFPDVIRYYGELIPSDQAKPSPGFQDVLDHLVQLYDAWILHWIAMLAFWGAVVGLVVSKDSTSACLYAVTVGTFFLFAYFQPQVSVRYLLHIALPAYFALTRDLFQVAAASQRLTSAPARA